MTLLYLASQLGRKISKLAFLESEYLRACIVSGHIPLNQSNTSPSIKIILMPIHTRLSILSTIAAYSK